MALNELDVLNKKRKGFESEGSWHKLMLDAYRGSGGFQGRVKQPEAGFWGEAAEAYSLFESLGTAFNTDADGSELDTYLDRFPREDPPKFRRRVQVAHYLNYVKPVTNLKISYVMRKRHIRNNVPDELAAWMQRTNYDQGMRLRALLSAVIGWHLQLVDRSDPNVPVPIGSKEKPGDPYVVTFLPCQVYDYALDDRGALLWVKLVTKFTRAATWDAPAEEVTRYYIWTRTTWESYEVTGSNQQVSDKNNGTHTAQVVPAVSWRSDTSIEDGIKADSINAEIVPEVRRLFNLLSELDENMRGNVFSLLVVPAQQSSAGDGEPKEGGTENGLLIDPEQKNVPFYLAPPASVADTYETRIEKTIIEIYRMARVEYDRASGVRSNAQSQEQNFQQTNLSIVDFATAIAQADRETLIIVGRLLGISEEQLQKIECIPHESYATDDLNDEIDAVIQAVTLAIGNTAKSEITKRLVWRILGSTLSADTKKTISDEIDKAVEQAARDAEALTAKELEPDPAAETEDSPVNDPPSDDDEGEP